MKKPIAMLMTAIMMLSIATSALTLSVGVRICAATTDNQYGGGADDIKVLQLAPLNPDFEAYWENPPETSYGYIPPPVDLSHLDQLSVVGLLASDALPSRFDWRDYGNVTSVKDQNPCGTCWIFGTTSVLESAVLIGESAEYNFSEQSVALCVDRSWTYLYDSSTDPCLGGGWSWLASEVFIKKGAVPESCNPYDTSALYCDGLCVCDDCPPVKNVDGYRLATNDGSQIDVIKNAVYTQGPVTAVFYTSTSAEYSVEPWGTIYDYYPCDEDVNHMVSIIGWDDDVPHPNASHGGTGAWIVKNSWGTGWGNSGFFYLAYESSCVTEVAYLEYKDPVPGEELLYWDEAGHVSSVGWGGDNDSAWMANVFTAAQSGDLTHVDFWTTSNNAQYEIYIWNGFFGSELANQTGSCQEYGYYSIPLSTPISIDAYQQFTVGVKMTTPGYGYPIPIEQEIPGLVDPPIQSDVSFIRHTSSDPWTDLAYDRNACLRVRLVGEVPDIYVDPTSFDVILLPDTIYSTNLTIGNDGNGTLTFEITDTEGGGGGVTGVHELAAKSEFSGLGLQEITKEVEGTIAGDNVVQSLEVASGEHEIAYDDGGIDYAHWWDGAGGAFGVNFTSPTYNTLSTLRFYIYSNLKAFDWKVLSWTGSQPGSVIASGTTTPTFSGWHDVDVESISVPSDFVVAICWKEANRPTLGSDDEPPIDNRSWNFNGTAWSSQNTVDYMIRAVMSSGEGWLSESPTSGTVESMTQTNITVTFNATGLTIDDYYANITITNNDPDENPVIIPVHLSVNSSEELAFDTGKGTYPSISGMHNGTIAPNQRINVSKMYTYPCTGTGGHSEYVVFSNATTGAEIANGTWKGYQGAGDYHYIEFDSPFVLEAGKTYNYTIITGSYPQIHHTPALLTENGWINCTKFTDANGKEHNNWIPAIRLE